MQGRGAALPKDKDRKAGAGLGAGSTTRVMWEAGIVNAGTSSIPPRPSVFEPSLERRG